MSLEFRTKYKAGVASYLWRGGLPYFNSKGWMGMPMPMPRGQPSKLIRERKGGIDGVKAPRGCRADSFCLFWRVDFCLLVLSDTVPPLFSVFLNIIFLSMCQGSVADRSCHPSKLFTGREGGWTEARGFIRSYMYYILYTIILHMRYITIFH